MVRGRRKGDCLGVCDKSRKRELWKEHTNPLFLSPLLLSLLLLFSLSPQRIIKKRAAINCWEIGGKGRREEKEGEKKGLGRP